MVGLGGPVHLGETIENADEDYLDKIRDPCALSQAGRVSLFCSCKGSLQQTPRRWIIDLGAEPGFGEQKVHDERECDGVFVPTQQVVRGEVVQVVF